jgi:hypothetical protein
VDLNSLFLDSNIIATSKPSPKNHQPQLLIKMAHDTPSIQAFYKPEIRLPNPINPPLSPTKPGDGFTEEELSDALDPLHRKWNPEREYEECGISQLAPGPRAVTFMGRVVNLKTILGKDRKQPKAKGFHSLIVRDDEGAISVCIFLLLDSRRDEMSNGDEG